MEFLHRAVPPLVARRLNLDKITATLHALQREFSSINPALGDHRDPMIDIVVANMVAGYWYVDWLLCQGIDLFAMGQFKHWLELNCLVLCGEDPARRQSRAGHRAATEQRFYDDQEGGIRDVVEWHARNRADSVWNRAAGVYIRILSAPQLFLEGNHRTGVLIISHMLAREGHPPLVLAPQSAQAFFDTSTVMKQAQKGSMSLIFTMPGLKERFAAFLQSQVDEAHLLPLV